MGLQCRGLKVLKNKILQTKEYLFSLSKLVLVYCGQERVYHKQASIVRWQDNYIPFHSSKNLVPLHIVVIPNEINITIKEYNELILYI